MSMDKDAIHLIDEDQALDAYLQALLTEPEPEVVTDKGGAALADMSRLLAEIPEEVAEPEPPIPEPALEPSSPPPVSRSELEEPPVAVQQPVVDAPQPRVQPSVAPSAPLEYAEPESSSPTLLPETLPIAEPEPLPTPVVEPVAPVPEQPPVVEAPVVAQPQVEEGVAAPEIVTPPVPQVATTPEVEASTQVAAETTPEPALSETGEPTWVEGPFQCLLFKVCGLTLAVPLTQLGGVFTWPETVTSLFGRPKWFLGIMPQEQGNIQVVDTSQWALPEKFHKQADQEFRYIILIGDKLWGLACDEVCEAVTLEPKNIRWRTQRGSRPWLAGTVIKHMCALLDVEQLGQLLDAQSSSSH